MTYVGLGTCDQCSWHEESGPKVWRWDGGEIQVNGYVFTDPCLCLGCLRRNGQEPKKEKRDE